MKKKRILKLVKNLTSIKFSIRNFVRDWIWQLPQNLLGLLYKVFTKSEVSYQIPINLGSCYTFYDNKYKGSVSLGNYIFLSNYAQSDSFTRNHEVGHHKQSLLLGPLYLLIIGIPSIIWAILYNMFPCINSKYNYYDFYTEKWANNLICIKHE